MPRSVDNSCIKYIIQNNFADKFITIVLYPPSKRFLTEQILNIQEILYSLLMRRFQKYFGTLFYLLLSFCFPFTLTNLTPFMLVTYFWIIFHELGNSTLQIFNVFMARRFLGLFQAVIQVIQAIADFIDFIYVNWADVVIVVVADIIHANSTHRGWIGTLLFTFWFPFMLTNLMFFFLRFSKDLIGILLLLSLWFCLTLTKLMLFILRFDKR